MAWQRPNRHGKVLSVVERGWRGARECSLTLNTMAIPVTHLIKGYLTREVRGMIRPSPYIRVVSVPRPLFRIWLWGMLLWYTARGRLQWLLLDHERTLKEVSWWCRVCGVTPVAIHETDEGYVLNIEDRPLPLAAVFQPQPRARP